MKNVRYDDTGKIRGLREFIGERVKESLSATGHTASSFAEVNYMAIGYGTKSAMAGFMCGVRNGYAFGAATDQSRDRTFHYFELKKLAGLFKLLKIEQTDPIFLRLAEAYPVFLELYNDPELLKDKVAVRQSSEIRVENRKFADLCSALKREYRTKSEEHVEKLRKSYKQCKNIDECKAVTSGLERALQNLKEKGLTEKLD